MNKLAGHHEDHHIFVTQLSHYFSSLWQASDAIRRQIMSEMKTDNWPRDIANKIKRAKGAAKIGRPLLTRPSLGSKVKKRPLLKRQGEQIKRASRAESERQSS